jgi:mono/diheme cytochrome c family protein
MQAQAAESRRRFAMARPYQVCGRALARRAKAARRRFAMARPYQVCGLRLRRTMLGLVLFWGFFAGACSRAPEETGQIPTLAVAPAAKAGEMIFQTRCFVCHGRGGKGDGPSSSGLGATVRDLTNSTWQDSTSDETIRNVIRNGATAIGGTAAMAPNPDLSNAQIQSLMLYIRSLRKE